MMSGSVVRKNALRFVSARTLALTSVPKAQQNSKNVTAKETRCYKATFTAPKRTEKSRVSSDNIQRFLARKEQEEMHKKQEANKKKEELLALRALDKKAQKRVQTMLKRTKSANKSVMEDAIDNYNTKDTLEGPQQCDNDDYGYVSQEASAFYEKLMAKYDKEPVEHLKQMSREVKDLQAAKDRVKAALDKEAEEQLHHTRKRKRKHEDGEDDDEEDRGKTDSTSSDRHSRLEESEPVKEKPKKIPKKMPPPVDFLELMKIAAKKQHEPIVIESKKAEEPERPLTMKEKLERQREMERKNRKNNPKPPSGQKSSNDKPQSSAKEELPSKPPTKSIMKQPSSVPESSKSKSLTKVKSDINKNTLPPPSSAKKEVKFSQSVEKSPSLPQKNGFNREKSGNAPEGKMKTSTSGVSKAPPAEVKKQPAKVDFSDIDKEIEMLMKKKKMLMEAQAKSEAVVQKPTSSKPNPPPKTSSPQRSSGESLSSQKPTPVKTQISKPANLPVKKELTDSRSKVPVKSGMNSRDEPERRNFKPDPRGPSYGPPQRKLPPPGYPRKLPSSQTKKKRVIDSESEYDSEMDDFIDDGPDESMDYSRHIKEIFGYDKSRYSHIDEDECQESNFRTQMIEERHSAKIGLMEDLEDIEREKEEKARAKARKMKMRR